MKYADWVLQAISFGALWYALYLFMVLIEEARRKRYDRQH